MSNEPIQSNDVLNQNNASAQSDFTLEISKVDVNDAPTYGLGCNGCSDCR